MGPRELLDRIEQAKLEYRLSLDRGRRMSRKMDRCMESLARLERELDGPQKTHLSGVLGRLLTVSNYLAGVAHSDRSAEQDDESVPPA